MNTPDNTVTKLPKDVVLQGNPANSSRVKLTFHNTFPPPRLDIQHLLEASIARLQQTPKGEDCLVVLPVFESQETKKNRVRLKHDDRSSPLGVVIKNDFFANQKYNPYAAARFDVLKVIEWCARNLEVKETE